MVARKSAFTCTALHEPHPLTLTSRAWACNAHVCHGKRPRNLKAEALQRNIAFIQESIATGGLSTIASH